MSHKEKQQINTYCHKYRAPLSSDDKRLKLCEYDWRVQAVTRTVSKFLNGQHYENGAAIVVVNQPLIKGRKITIQTPNPSAMYISKAWESIQRASQEFDLIWRSKSSTRMERKAKISIEGEEATLWFDIMEDIMCAVIFSYTAIEAFANEHIPDDYIYTKVITSGNTRQYNKNDIERHISLSEKLDVIIPNIHNIESPKGGKEWQGFSLLKKSRDRLIHIKSFDLRGFDDKARSKTMWNQLLQNRMFSSVEHSLGIMSYFYKESRKLPRWLERANAMVQR